jgi:hypothetical protein
MSPFVYSAYPAAGRVVCFCCLSAAAAGYVAQQALVLLREAAACAGCPCLRQLCMRCWVVQPAMRAGSAVREVALQCRQGATPITGFVTGMLL